MILWGLARGKDGLYRFVQLGDVPMPAPQPRMDLPTPDEPCNNPWCLECGRPDAS